MFVDMRVVSICVGLGVALGAPGGGSLLGVRRARFRGYAEEISEPTDVDSSTDEEEESTTPMPDDDDEDQSTSTESEVTTTTKKSVKSNKNGKSNDGKSNDGKSNDGKSNDGKSNDGKSSEKDKKKGGKGGKFKGYKEAIAFVVSKDFDEIFASNLIFQLIKYRNGDAALDNSLVSQVVDALSVCKPELEVIADLRNSTETNSGSTRGMMAKTLSTAVRRYYLNADSQGQSTKLIRHVVIAIQRFAQIAFKDPFQQKGEDGGKKRPSDNTANREQSPYAAKKRRKQLERELENLLREISQDIVDNP